METCSKRAEPVNKKHCMTKGLIEQLKARTSLKRAPALKSTLSILVWESPPLAKSYKISFLARLEPDGEEGLGFRFDDTTESKIPRQIAWGGTVGTADSPRCFLDGSQTFLTDSFAKASERCRRGWHVRIGKVSQIVSLFDNNEKSFIIRLSLRKLDSTTRITNLVSQTQRSDPFATYLKNPPDDDAWLSMPAPSAMLTLNDTSSLRIHQEERLGFHPPPSLSKNISLTRTRTPDLRISGTSSSATSATIPPSTLLTISGPFTKCNSRTDRCSRQALPPVISSRPHANAFEEAAILHSDPQRVNQAHASLITKPPSMAPGLATLHSDVPFTTNDQLILTAAESSDDTTLCQAIIPVTGPSDSNQDQSHSILNSSTSSKSDGAQGKPVMQTIATASDVSILPDPKPISPSDVSDAVQEMVCFIFPPNSKRPTERKLYIPYRDLIKVSYFKEAVQSPNLPLSIDESAPTRFRSIKTMKQVFFAPTQFILEWSVELQRSLLLNLEGSKRDLLHGILVAVANLGYGLTCLTWNTLLEAMKLVFKESARVLDAVVPQDLGVTNETDSTLWTKVVVFLGSAFRTLCKNGLIIVQYVTEEQPSDDEDGEVEFEPWLQPENVEPSSYRLKATFTINHLPYPTFCALADYLQYGAIRFLPLSSTFETQHKLAKMLSQVDLTASLAQDFPSARQDYFKSRCVNVSKYGLPDPDLRLIPCSPKSAYILADKLELTDLKELAHQQIIRGLSPLNIARELRTASVYNYQGLLQDYCNIAKSSLGMTD